MTFNLPAQRREDFTNRLKDFLVAHPEEILVVEKVFPGIKWRETLINVLGEIQRNHLIEGFDISVNSDYTKFYSIKIPKRSKEILVEVKFVV